MLLREIIEFIDKKIPKDLALKEDKIGFNNKYDLNQNISSIKIKMDLLKEEDNFKKGTLIITHHPPLFKPKTPTYTVHSNWDIINGGANDILAKTLNLKIIDIFDKENNIGKICTSKSNFSKILKNISHNFQNNTIKIVNKPNENKIFNKIAIISGFGLKNIEYIKLAEKENIDLIISGDLTQEGAILAKQLNITLIDLNHHNSEIPGLWELKEIINDVGIPVELIDDGAPWEYMKL